jgi:hypothetical protein
MVVTGFPLGLDASKVMEGGGSRITDCMRSGTLRAYPVICTSKEANTVACILPSSEGTRLHKRHPQAAALNAHARMHNSVSPLV